MSFALAVMLFGQLLTAGPETRPAQGETLNPKSEQIAPTKAGPESLPPAKGMSDSSDKSDRSDIPSAAQRATDTTKAAKSNVKKTRTVTTGKAMLLSALIPGGGQFYCHSYVKAGFYAAGELGIAGVTVYEDQVMRHAYDVRAPDTLSLRNRRNNLLWWTGAVWAFTIADAYVSASMYGFKEEQRFEAEVAPLGIGVCYRF
jgi:TM2 domain-containing membrane protein YozV